MAHDVFISHSSIDKTTADAVCATLESNGIRCWIAPRDVTPAMEWGLCIVNAIEECRIMVLVFSTNADDSSQIHREVECAVNHGVAILPFRIEDVLPGKALEYFIGDVHWLDALTTPMEAHLKSLSDTVKMLLAQTSTSGVTGSAKLIQPPSSAPPNADGPERAQVNRESRFPATEPAAVSTSPVSPTAVAGGSQRPPTKQLWFRASLGGVALLIVIFAAVYFSKRMAGKSTLAGPGTTPAAAQQDPMYWSNLDLATVLSAANNGNPGAESEIGIRHYFGQGGMTQDYLQALPWFRKAADQGDAAGENGLGLLYVGGEVVPKDCSLAVGWFSKAADQGYAYADLNLGNMYESGDCVQQDYAQALVWFHKSADKNNAMAQDYLGYVYLDGHGVPKDVAQARIWFQKAADQGYPDALRELATLAGKD
jgi:hypothetical protein